MEWTRDAISDRRPATWLAALPVRRIESDVHARPRQPARPDLGVRHSAPLARATWPSAIYDRARPARPHPPADRLHRGRRRGCARSSRGPATRVRARRGPAACSTRAASASRATATRAPATWSSTPTPGPRPGTGSPTTSRPSRHAMRAAGLPDRLADRLSYRRLIDRPMIGGRRPLQGRKPGDRRVRVERPHAAVLPLHRPGPADGQGSGQRARRPRPGRRLGAHPRRSSSAGRWRARRSSASGCRRPRRSRSSAPTRSARRPTRPRRSCAS